MKLAHPQDVTVRFFDESDVEEIANYFTKSPREFIEGIGLNPENLGKTEEFIERYRTGLKTLAAENRKPKIITVFYKSEKVGFHTSTHYIENESLTLHAHYFNQAMRGKGIGPIGGLKAGDLLLREFNLKEIILKIPLQNKSPLRIVEKLGLKSDTIEIIDWPQLIRPMEAKVFRINREQSTELKKKFNIE